MSILLVDNHSKHRDKLIQLFSEHAIIETQEQLRDFDTNLYDLIILSGGSNVPSVLYHPEAYKKEYELIRNTKTPILGICLGCEIVTRAFDGNLKDLNSVHRGDINLTITDESLKNTLLKETLVVYEAHEVGIKDLPNNFIVCATSEHGPEIIKHITKPIMGIQFHPEVEPEKKLIEWIINTLKISN
jgi:GMP synthase (glutamine-hydrolysing)